MVRTVLPSTLKQRTSIPRVLRAVGMTFQPRAERTSPGAWSTDTESLSPDERPYARVVQSYECVRQHLDVVGGGRDRRQGARAHRAAPGRGHGGVAEGPRGRERRAVRGNRANRGRRGAGPHAGRRRRGFQGGAVHIGGLLVPKPPSMPCSSGVGVFTGEALFRATANPKPRKNAKRCSCTARPQRAGVEGKRNAKRCSCTARPQREAARQAPRSPSTMRPPTERRTSSPTARRPTRC